MTTRLVLSDSVTVTVTVAATGTPAVRNRLAANVTAAATADALADAGPGAHRGTVPPAVALHAVRNWRIILLASS